MKTCIKCDTEKPLGDFHNEARSRDGKSRACKACRRRYVPTTEERRARERKWREANPEKWEAAKRRHALKHRYGIEPADYDAMLMAQDGRCAICGGHETQVHNYTGKIRNLAVDHDHSTGNVRGLLCAACNRALGLMKDNTDLLVKAAEYLRSTADLIAL